MRGPANTGPDAAEDAACASRRRRGVASLLATMAAAVALAGCAATPQHGARDFVVVHARIVDGSGAPARAGAVRVHDRVIVAIGELVPAAGERVIDAHGLALAPGFVDTHSHHDRGMDEAPAMAAAVSQGVTTLVVGQDGFSDWPLTTFADARRRRPVAVNVASYTGHNTLRAAVMGEDFRRPATAGEQRRMAAMLARDLRAGSLGLSTGLEYDPGIYSQHDEVLALARVAGSYGGRYISHMRSEDVALDAAIDELLEIGRRVGLPVQISHLKLAITDRWGDARGVLAKLDAARSRGVQVTADVYPYTYWQSNLAVLFPKRDFTDLAAAEFALTHLTTPDGMLISEYAPDPTLVGRTIGAIARERGLAPARLYLDLVERAESGHADNAVIGTAMDERDVAELLLWPHANVCSDGQLVDRHPRGAGAFTRVLAWLVRGEHRLSFEQAVAKMSALAAAHVGLADRGRIALGAPADLVLLDPETVADRATIAEPAALSTGIERVWVNGVAVWESGHATGARPGLFLRRGAGRGGTAD